MKKLTDIIKVLAIASGIFIAFYFCGKSFGDSSDTCLLGGIAAVCFIAISVGTSKAEISQ